ncbi:MAG: hypothetical protein P8179_15800 [Candidatus Thiodiazotropha sp.]
MPPPACHSRSSVIHPVSGHNHRSYFLQNQKPVIRMERSTDFFRFNAMFRAASPPCHSTISPWHLMALPRLLFTQYEIIGLIMHLPKFSPNA